MKNAFGGLLNTKRHYTHSWIHETLVDLLCLAKKGDIGEPGGFEPGVFQKIRTFAVQHLIGTPGKIAMQVIFAEATIDRQLA